MQEPRFLFVPVTGPGGSGEYHRALAIARGLLRRWPDAEVRFVLNRQAPYAASCPYPGLLLDDSPTRARSAVEQYVREVRAHVVIFDSAGRLSQYQAARKAGGRVVYISSRPKTRWKGFRLRRMRALDQHWIAQPRMFGGAPGFYERIKLSVVGRPEIVILDTLYEPVDLDVVRSRQRELGIVPQGYVLLCPGGGGTFEAGTDPARVFLEAARALVGRRAEPVVAVLGDRLYAESDARKCPSGLKLLPRLANGELLGLVRDSAVAAVNGGSLLLQSMAQGVPLVAAPIAGDQPARIHHCAATGCVLSADLDAADLAGKVSQLLDDEAARARMREASSRLELHNGVETATEAVARLLETGTSHTEVRA